MLSALIFKNDYDLRQSGVRCEANVRRDERADEGEGAVDLRAQKRARHEHDEDRPADPLADRLQPQLTHRLTTPVLTDGPRLPG
jgi:hypothetical protein